MELNLVISVPLAIVAALLTEVLKQAVPERYHNFVPLTLTVIVPAFSAGLWVAQGFFWVDGLIQGVVSTAGAVYGWSFVVKTIAGVREAREA